MALQLRYSLDLLNNTLPFKAILDLSCLFSNFHLFQVIPDIVFPSGLELSYWSSCGWFPFAYFDISHNFGKNVEGTPICTLEV
jgi:hypothetical protein